MVLAKLMIQSETVSLDATVDSFGYYMSQVATEVTLRVLAGQDIPRVVHTPQALIDSTNVDKDAAEIIGWTDANICCKIIKNRKVNS